MHTPTRATVYKLFAGIPMTKIRPRGFRLKRATCNVLSDEKRSAPYCICSRLVSVTPVSISARQCFGQIIDCLTHVYGTLDNSVSGTMKSDANDTERSTLLLFSSAPRADRRQSRVLSTVCRTSSDSRVTGGSCCWQLAPLAHSRSGWPQNLTA